MQSSSKGTYIQHIKGTAGVHARNCDKSKIKSLGWEAAISSRDRIARTCAWIEKQVSELEG